ncbi:MAG: sugar ABC transporter permease [Clostridia bacterium]
MNGLGRRIRTETPYVLFTVPALFFVAVFLFYPLAAGVRIAFLDWDGFSQSANFVGLDNFKRIFRDISLTRDLRNTLLFTLLETFFCNIFGLLMALMFKRSCKLNGLLKTLVFMPFVISLVLSSYMIQNMLYELCSWLNITNPLAVPKLVIPGISMIAIWRDSGYCMVIYVAALLSVDESMYEAATIEGAGKWKKFSRITLPLIMPAITANITLLLSWGLKLFDYSITTVRGDASESINIYVYKLIFPGYRAGYGQAVALAWLIVVFLLTNFLSKLLRSREVEI